MVDRPPGSKALTQDAKISSSQSLPKLMVIYLGIFVPASPRQGGKERPYRVRGEDGGNETDIA